MTVDHADISVRWVIYRTRRGVTEYFVFRSPTTCKDTWATEPHKAQTYISKSGAQYAAGTLGLADVLYASRTII